MNQHSVRKMPDSYIDKFETIDYNVNCSVNIKGDCMGFGDLIRKFRVDRKIGLREFARMVGISPAFVSQMEKGEFKPPGEDTIRRMAQVLGFDEDYLLAQAKKISSDIKEIITENITDGSKVPEFLRLAKEKSLTPEDWNKLIQQLKDGK
ncbi:MAG: helix-turn-helix domain-containing protein [Candidatus Eremiobacteraeota bacterium]|nr:helix-turn-helix domain-containing protein [Candidatus Eremiobacteraeota bacterium]